MRHYFNLTVWAWLVTAATANPLIAAPATPLDKRYVDKIDELLPGMGAQKIIDRKDAQLALEKMCFEASGPGKQAERAALSRAIMARVGPQTAKPARVWLLRKIESLGRGEVVTDLKNLFRDQDPQIRELARRALENNPSPQAAAALRAELDAATDDEWRIALINAVGWRRDADSVKLVSRFSTVRNEPVMMAAISALGKIATAEAAEVLAKVSEYARTGASLDKELAARLQSAVADARLRCAEAMLDRDAKENAAGVYEDLRKPTENETVRTAALHGIVRARGADALGELLRIIRNQDAAMQSVAARLAQDIPGPAATRQIAAALGGAKPGARALLLQVLGRRGDRAALPSVLNEKDNADQGVRTAAMEALGHLGDASVVPLLAKHAAQARGEERDAARGSLARLRGEDVDEAIVKALTVAKTPVRAELIRAAAARRIEAAKSFFLDAAQPHEPDPALRVAGIVAVQACATEDDFPRLLELALKVEGLLADVEDPALKAEAAEALLAIAMRVSGKHQDVSVAALESLRERVTGDAMRSRLDQALDSLTSYCVAWLVSGPYKKEGKSGGDLIDVPFAPETPQGGATWRRLPVTDTDQPGRFDLGRGDNCCAYVKTSVWSDRQRKARLDIGSDDGVKVWLNDTVVHSNNASRGVRCGEDKVDVTLKKGGNPLMLKITQGGGGWGFCCAVRAPDGGRVPGLKFQAR